jgi:hypothetical protein
MGQTAFGVSMGGQCLDHIHVNIGVGQRNPLSTYLHSTFIVDQLERLAM